MDQDGQHGHEDGHKNGENPQEIVEGGQDNHTATPPFTSSANVICVIGGRTPPAQKTWQTGKLDFFSDTTLSFSYVCAAE